MDDKYNIDDIIQMFPYSLFEDLDLVSIEKGKNIFNKGDGVSRIYIVCTGKFRIINEFIDGTIHNYAYVYPNDIVGALEVVAGKKYYAATVQAVENASFYVMDSGKFLEAYENNHELTLYVGKMLSNMFYNTSYYYGNILKNSPMVSIAMYITNIAGELINADKAGEISVTRQYMADELGLSLRTIYRNIKKLKDKGLISVNNSIITIGKTQYSKLLQYIEKN